MDDAEKLQKFIEIQVKFQKIEDEEFILDRLIACDSTGATDLLRDFLDIK